MDGVGQSAGDSVGDGNGNGAGNSGGGGGGGTARHDTARRDGTGRKAGLRAGLGRGCPTRGVHAGTHWAGGDAQLGGIGMWAAAGRRLGCCGRAGRTKIHTALPPQGVGRPGAWVHGCACVCGCATTSV